MADVIYTYNEEYKEQGVREGLNPANIVVVGNPIVDVLNDYYYARRKTYEAMASDDFFQRRGLKRGQFFLMTCHRRENVHIEESFRAILDLMSAAPYPVYFPASYRTQKVIAESRPSCPRRCAWSTRSATRRCWP